MAGSGLLQTRRRLQLTEPWREDHITCQPGVGWTVAGASRQRPGETPGTAQPSPGQPGAAVWRPRPAASQTAATGGSGGRLQQTRGAARTRPGPAQIQPAQPLDNAQSHQEAALRPQCVSQRSTLLSENDGHLMFCLMCPLSLSVSPPVAAAGLPPPPPALAGASRNYAVSSLQSPHVTSSQTGLSVSLSRNTFCNLYTSQWQCYPCI